MYKNQNYQSIEADLRKRITRKEWDKGEKLPSLREFANEYGCSVNTVQKALKPLESLGYIVRNERKKTIISENMVFPETKGIIASFVIGIDNPLWMSALRGIEDYIHNLGFSLISVSHEQSIERLEKSIDNLINIKIDGAILAPFDHTLKEREMFDRMIKLLEEKNIKVVFFDRYRYDLKIPYVTTNNTAAAYKLTKHLIDNGHNNIGFVRTSSVNTISERLTGFKQACYDTEQYIKYTDIFIQTSNEDFKDEIDYFSAKLESTLKNSGITALFTSNDQIAKAVIATLKRLNLEIPDDISLVTYDVDNIKVELPYKITGIKQNFYDIGKASAETLINMIYSKTPEGNKQMGYIIPADMIYGDTVKTITNK